MKVLDSWALYHLGWMAHCRYGVEVVARDNHISLGQARRLKGYYALFHDALGFKYESGLWALGPRKLDALRAQIDWNYKELRIGAGLGGRWTKTQARKEIRKLLGEIREHENPVDHGEAATAPGLSGSDA
jgi:hypothetical protein